MKEVLARLIQDSESPPWRPECDARIPPGKGPGLPAARGRHDPARVPRGTALRFLYALARRSEDLQLAVEGDAARYNLQKYAKAIAAEFHREG